MTMISIVVGIPHTYNSLQSHLSGSPSAASFSFYSSCAWSIYDSFKISKAINRREWDCKWWKGQAEKTGGCDVLLKTFPWTGRIYSSFGYCEWDGHTISKLIQGCLIANWASPIQLVCVHIRSKVTSDSLSIYMKALVAKRLSSWEID